MVRFELAAETFALLRQARAMLNAEQPTNLGDDEFVAALCRAVLDGDAPGEPSGRARYQVAVTVCERCRAGWQEGAGAQIAIKPAAVERALCDAEHIGSLDGAAPERAHQDIAPSTVRFVRRRDGGRCRVPGCRSARGLETHHVVHRADGGGHEPPNLVLLCSSCHLAHHRGALTICVTADQLEVHRPSDGDPIRAHVDAGGAAKASGDPIRAHVDVGGAAKASGDPIRAHVDVGSRLDAAILQTQAKEAPMTLGWKPATAHAAVAAAMAASAAGVRLEQLIFEALRRCPVPKA